MSTSTTGTISTTILSDASAPAKIIYVQEDIFKGATLLGSTYRTVNFTTSFTTNLALNKPATALNSLNGSYLPAKANDGITGADNMWYAANTTDFHWWQVDLGAAYTITSVDFMPRQNLDQPLSRRDFEIRASNASDMSGSVVLASQGSTSTTWIGFTTYTVSNPNSFRYLRVIKSIAGHLAISEFRAFGNRPNLALNKTATSSSNFNGNFLPAKAVDGLVLATDNGWSSASGAALHWWQVDLGAAYTITSVELVYRQDLSQPSTRRSFEIQASNASDMSGSVVLASKNATTDTHQGTFTGTVSNTTPFRYIRAQKTVAEIFFIAEFRVYGY